MARRPLPEGEGFRSLFRLYGQSPLARIISFGVEFAPSKLERRGYTEVKTNRTEKESYTRENLIDHLRRLVYYGVVATVSMGADRGEIPFQVRAQPTPGAALFFTAGGRGGEVNRGTLRASWTSDQRSAR